MPKSGTVTTVPCVFVRRDRSLIRRVQRTVVVYRFPLRSGSRDGNERLRPNMDVKSYVYPSPSTFVVAAAGRAISLFKAATLASHGVYISHTRCMCSAVVFFHRPLTALATPKQLTSPTPD